MRHMLLPSLRSTDAPNVALRPAGSFAQPASRRYGLGEKRTVAPIFFGKVGPLEALEAAGAKALASDITDDLIGGFNTSGVE